MLFRFESYSRAVFFIDWMVLLLGVSGVRVAIRMIKEYLGTWAIPKGKRLLIMGAGDAGDFALREIRNNPVHDYFPVGFIDDNRAKVGHNIHGVPVLGRRADLLHLVEKYRIDEIMIAIPSVDAGVLETIIEDCEKTGVLTQVWHQPRQLSSPISA